MKKLLTTSFLLFLFVQLQGCAGGLIVVAGTAVAVTSDERSISEQLDDSKLSVDALDKINELDINHQAMRINLITNSGYLLVIGQVSDQPTKNMIEKKLKTLENAKGVYNQLRINKPIGLTQQSHDSWLTTKVKSHLASHETVNPLKIKVVTEDAEVFLIGRVNKKMAKDATNVTRNVDGVKQVNRVFQLIEEEK